MIRSPLDRDFDSQSDEARRKSFPSQPSMSEGNRRGNTRGSREVFPLRPAWFIRIAVDEKALDLRLRHANFNRRCRLLSMLIGRRFVPPTSATPWATWSIAGPWRERPRDLAAWPAKPAATQVVAHATLSLSQPEPVSSDAYVQAA